MEGNSCTINLKIPPPGMEKIADHSTNGPRKFSEIAVKEKMKGCDVKRKWKNKKMCEI